MAATDTELSEDSNIALDMPHTDEELEKMDGSGSDNDRTTI